MLVQKIGLVCLTKRIVVENMLIVKHPAVCGKAISRGLLLGYLPIKSKVRMVYSLVKLRQRKSQL